MIDRVKSPHSGVLIAAGALLGIGLGGILDAIVFRQILQWHHLLSNVVAPNDLASLKFNLVWDGLFQAFTWAITVLGLALLWRVGQDRRVPWSTPTFVGSLSLGWGLFNVVEGFIDHQLIGLHHLHPGVDELAWDMGFLLFGALLVGLGWTLIRADHPRTFGSLSSGGGSLRNARHSSRPASRAPVA